MLLLNPIKISVRLLNVMVNSLDLTRFWANVRKTMFLIVLLSKLR